MNRYINKIVLALSLLSLLAACGKPEQEVVEKKALSVVSSDVIFGVEGGTGSILVEADESVTATSERAWCQVSVDGKKIVVSVPEANPSRMSRYARITIKAGSTEAHVTAQQYGEVFSGIALEDAVIPKEGATFTLSYTANMDVRMSSDQDWVHFEMIEDEELGKLVKVVVDENAGFGTRFATVSYAAGSNSGSARFTQEPTYGAVTGWTVEDTDGQFVFPDQFDVISVAPPSGMASTSYYWDVVDPGEFVGVDVVAVLKETADGLKAAADAGEITFTKGSASKEFKNLPSTATAVILVFDDQNYPTGPYALVEVAVPDRGPQKQLVDGWDVAHTDASWADHAQTDVFTITPKAGYEDVKYIATAIQKNAIADVEDFAFTNFAMSTREEILAKVASGELPNFEAGLTTGTSSITAVNMPGEVYVVVVAFGDNKFYTGAYEADLFDVPSAKPLAYNWVGKWSVVRKNDKYDTVDTWQISIEEDEKTLKILGIEGLTDYTRYFAYATVDEEGKLVLKTQYAGSYEDSSRGHVDVLLSGQYDDTSAGKTYYTSSLNVTLLTGTLSEDGATADLTPGPINGYYFKNIQFYGRYKKENGSMSAVSWNAGPTAIPQTITRIAE